jgi:hypothetical protein
LISGNRPPTLICKRVIMGVSRRSWLTGLLGLAVTATLIVGPPQPAAQTQGGDLVVFAAASLKNAEGDRQESADLLWG